MTSSRAHGGPGEVAPGRGHPGQPDLGRGRVGPPQRPVVGALGLGQAAGAQVQVAQEGLDVGHVGGGGTGAGDGGLGHGRDGTGGVAGELTEVGRPGQAGQRGPAVEHPLEVVGGGVVAAELDLGVDHHPQRLRRGGVEAVGPATEVEGRGEVMAAEGQQAQPGEGGGTVGRQGVAAVEGLSGPGEVGRVRGLPSPDEVGLAQSGEQSRVVGRGTKPGLEVGHGGLRGRGRARRRRCGRAVAPGQREPAEGETHGPGHGEGGQHPPSRRPGQCHGQYPAAWSWA